MRHLLTTTTVNIAGSGVNSGVIIAGDRDTHIPHDFFFNDSILGHFLSQVNVRRSIPFPGVSIAERGQRDLDSNARRSPVEII